MSAPRLRGEAERCRLCRAPLGTRGLPRTLSRVTSCTQDPVPGQTLCLGSLLWVWRAAAPCWGLLLPACTLGAAAPSAPRPRCSRCRWGPRGLPGQPPALTPHLPPGDPAAEEWSQWSVCSLTCGQGSQVRTRSCVSSPYGTLCSGLLRETRTCNNTATCPGTGGHGGVFRAGMGLGDTWGHVLAWGSLGGVENGGVWGRAGRVASCSGGSRRSPAALPPFCHLPCCGSPRGSVGGGTCRMCPRVLLTLPCSSSSSSPEDAENLRASPGKFGAGGEAGAGACTVGLGPGGLVRGRRWPSCSSTVLSRGASRMDACGGTSSALPVRLSAHSQVRVSCVGLRGPVGPRGAAGLPRPGGAGGLCTP